MTAYKNLYPTLSIIESTFKVEKENLNQTIQCLLEAKKKLEDRLEATEDSIKKLQAELLSNQANTSASSDMSTSSVLASPRSPRNRSLDNATHVLKPLDNTVNPLALQKERKIRLLNVHDERRRSSGLHSPRTDTATQAEDNEEVKNVNPECNECKKLRNEVFFRESQILVLNMNIRHHPVKAENVRLTNRIKEDQQMYQKELEKLKDQLSDCENKYFQLKDERKNVIAKLLIHACTSPAKSITYSKHSQTDGENSIQTNSKETQTEGRFPKVISEI